MVKDLFVLETLQCSERELGERETYVCSGKGGQVLARSHHDQTQGGNENHQNVALSSTPDVEDLGYRDETCCGNGIGNNEGHVEFRMGFELAGDVGDEGHQDGILHGVDKVEQPYTAWVSFGSQGIG